MARIAGLTCVIVVCLFTSAVRSWWCTGHMLVAQIAYNDLKANRKTPFTLLLIRYRP